MDADKKARLLRLAQEDAARREAREAAIKAKRQKSKMASIKVHDIPFDWAAIDRDYSVRGL
jgi:hypothetical protein